MLVALFVHRQHTPSEDDTYLKALSFTTIYYVLKKQYGHQQLLTLPTCIAHPLCGNTELHSVSILSKGLTLSQIIYNNICVKEYFHHTRYLSVKATVSSSL